MDNEEINESEISFMISKVSLNQLTTLNLSKLNIVELPDSFYQLNHLVHVDISHNNIESIEGNFSSIDSLSYFNASFNKIIKVPDWINKSFRLNTLNLSHNPLNINNKSKNLFTNEIKKRFRRLRYLNLAQCSTNYLPDVIFQIRDLTSLVLGSSKEFNSVFNKIDQIPSTINQLQNLVYLKAPNCCMKQLPDEIDCLKNLKYLDIQGNCLNRLPKTIGNLVSLEYFDASRNLLDYLPLSIDSLSKLNILLLAHNYITWITENITNIKDSLEYIDLYGNKYSGEEIECFSLLDLKGLDLANNNIYFSDMKSFPNLFNNYENLEKNLREKFLSNTDSRIQVYEERPEKFVPVSSDSFRESDDNFDDDNQEDFSDATVVSDDENWDTESDKESKQDKETITECDDDWDPTFHTPSGRQNIYSNNSFLNYYINKSKFVPSDIHAERIKKTPYEKPYRIIDGQMSDAGE